MLNKIDNSVIRALAIDLDGTALLPDSSMGERTVQCLKKLMSKGIQVIICTGRATEASQRYYNAIGAQGPMVFFNGAEVVDVPSIKIVSSKLLDLEIVSFGIDLARKMDVHFHVFLPMLSSEPDQKGEGSRWNMLLVEKNDAETEMYFKHTGIQPVVVDIKVEIARLGVQGCPKVMFITDPALHGEIRQKLLERFGSRIYMARSFPTFLEVMNAGVSKGEGLKTAMACRGLKPEEVIACGDEENDLPMFSVAGFSAAPSSAKEAVRQAADFVFGPNAEEGLAAFLEEVFG